MKGVKNTLESQARVPRPQVNISFLKSEPHLLGRKGLDREHSQPWLLERGSDEQRP